MTHANRLIGTRRYESERALAYEAWQKAALAKVKDVKTADDVRHIDDADKLVDWFTERYNIEWEDVLREMAQRLRERRR